MSKNRHRTKFVISQGTAWTLKLVLFSFSSILYLHSNNDSIVTRAQASTHWQKNVYNSEIVFIAFQLLFVCLFAFVSCLLDHELCQVLSIRLVFQFSTTHRKIDRKFCCSQKKRIKRKTLLKIQIKITKRRQSGSAFESKWTLSKASKDYKNHVSYSRVEWHHSKFSSSIIISATTTSDFANGILLWHFFSLSFFEHKKRE